MASLYELSAGYASIVDAYDTVETEQEREELLDMLADAQDEIAAKAENYAKIIRMKEEEAKAFKAEADRLTERRQAAEHMAKRLKAAMLDAMKLTNMPEIKTSIGKFRLQMNPWSCEVTDWTQVPSEYRTPQPDKVDRKGLVDHFKATGEMIDGVEFRQEQGIRFR